MTADHADLALHEVDPERRAAVALDASIVRRRQWDREHRRPPALTAREALAAVRFESLLIWAAWGHVLWGGTVTTEDRDRANLAMQRIEQIFDETGA